MGVQTIRGILTDGSAPLANVVVEVQFSYGASQVTGPGVVAKTDDDGSFSVDVFNNAQGVDKVALTIAENIITTFDFDPEEAEVDIGTVVMATDIGGRPRLISAAAATVDLEPKLATTVIAPTDKTYLLQSDCGVSGIADFPDVYRRSYTYAGVHNGKPWYKWPDAIVGSDGPQDNAVSYDNGVDAWKFWSGGINYFRCVEDVPYPWATTVAWEALEVGYDDLPVITEKPESKQITLAVLAAAIDAILNP